MINKPTDLNKLKSKADKLHIKQLKNNFVDLSKLNNIVFIKIYKMLRLKILKMKYLILLN